MRKLCTRTAASIVWGVAAGVAVGVLQAHEQGYLGSELWRLTLERIADSIGPALMVAVLAGWLAQAIGWVGERVRPPLVAHGLGVAAWLTASLPVWLWAGLAVPWLLPQRPGMVRVLAALLIALHLAAYLAVRVARRTATAQRRAAPKLSFVLTQALAGLCLLLAGGLVAAHRVILTGPSDGAPLPNVLLVVLDTVRMDRLSLYGHTRKTSYEIDDFARDAIRFTNFHATSSWTLPSHGSLFTGLYPIAHGATNENSMLGHGLVTLAEVFRNAGYHTWAASGNPYVSVAAGMLQGFETFVETFRETRSVSRASHPANRAFERMLATNRRQPFFAFINYTEAHVPYAPREPYRSRFQEPGTDIDAAMVLGRRSPAEHYLTEPFTQGEFEILSRLYDAEIAELSATVGDLLRTLRRDGRFDDTWIVITSDHGEYFGENGLFEHVFGLYNTAIDVPLIIRPPGGTGAPRVDDRAGQLVDLFPTLLATAGIDDRGISHHGFDLLSQDPAPRRKSIFTECYFPVRFLQALEYHGLEVRKDRVRGHLRRLRALEVDGFRLIWSSDGRHEFYDLTKDPGETVNLYESGEFADLVDDYLQRLRARVSEYGANSALPALREGGMMGRAAAPPLDAETRDALRELGYAR